MGGLGGLVQQRNSISISDNTQGGGGGGCSDNPAYSQGETDTLTLKHIQQNSLPSLNLSFSFPLP